MRHRASGPVSSTSVIVRRVVRTSKTSSKSVPAQAPGDTWLRAIHARLRPIHRGWPPEVARHAEPALPRGVPAHRIPARLPLLARRAVLMDTFVEFLVLFVVAAGGFVVGIGFMA